MIFIKENNSDDKPVFDDVDNSVCRSRNAFEKLIADAGLEVVSHDFQEGFPEELFKVSIWSLRSKK